MAARRGRRGRDDEIKVSGRHAVRALFERQPESLVRVYIDEEAMGGFRDLLKHCARRRLAYHVVDPEELGRVSGSSHHEGVCVLARRVPVTLDDLLSPTKAPTRLLALDGVDNPHNLGAILRTAAHFGVRGLICEGPAALTPAAHRVAEGGASHVDVVAVPDLVAALEQARGGGFRIVGTAGGSRRPLYEERFARRSVIVLGSERSGMRRAVSRACDTELSLPGTGAVESLNVSAACAVILSEAWRQSSWAQ